MQCIYVSSMFLLFMLAEVFFDISLLCCVLLILFEASYVLACSCVLQVA